ncbi:MAG: sulfurtransferase TusA family protein [Actinomycetota bacterium]|nr:sulfurtransferase TusA family protein [Actinomycetota bacterium]
MTGEMDTVAIAEAWLGRFSTGDFDGAAALFDPDVEMRALLPDGPHTYNGRKEVTGRLRWWFGSGDEVRSVHAEARAVGDRVELSYGFRILNAVEGAIPGWHLIEQRAFCDIGTTIERADIVCSGFRPIIETSGQLHRFDAGEMGCGDGLPQEFRRWVRSIPVGDVMEVVTKDPAAKEDLPSLARLMGNTVRSNEALEDGRLLISVERGR